LTAATHLTVFTRQFKVGDCEVLVSAGLDELQANTALNYVIIRHAQIKLVARLRPVARTFVLRKTTNTPTQPANKAITDIKLCPANVPDCG